MDGKKELRESMLDDDDDDETQIQFLDEAVCISLCANTLGKGMNPTVHLLPAIGK